VSHRYRTTHAQSSSLADRTGASCFTVGTAGSFGCSLMIAEKAADMIRGLAPLSPSLPEPNGLQPSRAIVRQEA